MEELPAITVEDSKAQLNFEALKNILTEVEEGSYPPSGAAGGALTGEYPNPTLATATKELFLQLAIAASRKVNFGNSELTYPGGAEGSNEKKVEHKLGVTPIVVLLTVSGGESGFNSWIRHTEKTETIFKVFCQNPGKPGVGSVVTFDWLAIG